MIKVENIYVYNFFNALRGARNPLESWDKADSTFDKNGNLIKLGENDRKLAMNLIKAGSDERKFLRQIFISMDINAPLYWWKEMDTYKVGTVANSTSTMHKLGSRLLTPQDFSWDSENGVQVDYTSRQYYLEYLNVMVKKYQEYKGIDSNKAKEIWRRLIQDLPCSYNQLRTVTFNYENARNMYHARKNHKLTEWRKFCEVLETLPCSEFITIKDKNKEEY